MISHKDFKSSVKSSSKNRKLQKKLSHAQQLNKAAIELGFQSLNHLKTSLDALPAEERHDKYSNLLSEICAKRVPADTTEYFEFNIPQRDHYAYFSKWVGVDRSGTEIRVPRAIDPVNCAKWVEKRRKSSSEPTYIIESFRELNEWQTVWLGTAFLSEKLARECFAFDFLREKQVYIEVN